MTDILAAHSITFDSFSGDLFLFGGHEIVQIAPTSPRTLKSTKRFALTGHFDQGTTDGRGHLFVAHNTGRVVFIDYASTGRVGDEDNVVAVAFLDSNLDDVAPMSGPGAKPDPPPPEPAAEDPPPPPEPPVDAAEPPPAAGGEGAGIGVPEAAAAAAAAALAAVLAWMGYLVLGRKRGTEGGRPGAGPPPPAAWREDWSETRALVDQLAEGGIDDLAAYLQGDPEAARAAAAAVKVLGDETSPSSQEPGAAAAALQRAATRYPEDAHLARFNEILAAFAGGSQRVTSRIAAIDDEGPVRVVHSIAEPAKASWARVDVTAAAEHDESPGEGDEKALQAVERAVSGLLVGADPSVLAERLLAEVTAATDSTLAYVAEVNTGRGGEVDFEVPVAVAGATDPAAAAALGAEVARRFEIEGFGGGSIFGETDAGPFVAVALRADGAVVGMLALAGRAAGYEAHVPAILGPAAAVLAAAIAGDHDRDGRIEAAVHSLEEAVADVGAAAAGQELARLTAAASGEVRAVQVDLSAMAGEIAADLAKDAPGRAVRFDIAEGVSARGDPRLLRMALEGLLGNAWAATAANARAEIGFGAGEEGEERTFFVHDNRADFTAGPPEGDGVSLGRLYDAGAVAGAEAVLATVQRVIDRHGGRARASGQPGQGARFDFTLPAAGGEGARAAPATWRMIPTKRR